ncbi:hypothetical protein DFS34DRAFT_633921 [Phlyctochytrium arcticum]|nr:hypothetical protein DFS34DRAFT_633921 [Phlyctochytrium arcticum]
MSNHTILPPCDWRLNVYNCYRSDVFLIIHYFALIADFSGFLGTAITLYQRVRHLKGRVWTSSSGFSSTEALLFFTCIGFSGRVGTSVGLIRDNLSMVARSYMWEVPWLFGLVGIQLFMVGIATVASQARQFKQIAPAARKSNFLSLPSKRIIYIAVWSQLSMQIITNLPLAYLAGRYEYSADIMAWPWSWYHIVHYTLWSIYLFVLAAAFFYYSLTLMNELLTNCNDTKGTVDVDSGIAKQAGRLRIQLLALSLIYGIFGFFLLAFAWLRHWILSCTEFSAFLCFGWVMICPTSILIFCYVTYFSDRQKIQHRDTPSQPSSFAGSGGATTALNGPRANSYVLRTVSDQN